MADKNFKVKNGLEVGDREIVTPDGVVTLPSGTVTLAEVNSPTFTGYAEFDGIVDFTEAVVIGIDALPDQTGQAGKFLTTDGTDASWADSAPSPHPFSMIG